MITLFVVGSAELLLPAVVEDFSVAEELEVVDSEVPEDDCCGGVDGSVCGGFDGVDEEDDEDGGVEEDGGHEVDGWDDGVLDDEVGVDEEVVGQFGVEGCEGGVEDEDEEDGGFDVPGLPPGLPPGSGLLLPGAGFWTLLPVFGSDGRASTFSLYSLAHLRTVWTYVVELL